MAQRSSKGRRRTTGTKRSTYNKRNTKAMRTKDIELWQDIKIILLIAVAIFLFICNFGLIGAFGNVISDFLFGVFGLMNYCFSLFVAALIIYTEICGRSKIAIRKDVAFSVLFVLINMVVDLISGVSKNLDKYNLKAIYEFSSENHKGGGVISASLNYVLCKSINVAGTVIFIVVALLIVIILLTEKSLIKSVGDTSRLVKERTSIDREIREEVYKGRREEDAIRRDERDALREEKRLRKKEERAFREEELRAKREERRLQKESEKLNREDEKVLKNSKKVTGVTFNTDLSNTVLTEPKSTSLVNDEIHEINLNNFNPGSLQYSEVFEEDDVEEVIVYEEVEEIPEESVKEISPEIIKKSPAKPAPKKVEKPVEKKESAVVLPTPMESSGYVFPPKELLKKSTKQKNGYSGSIDETGRKLMNTLTTYGVEATLSGYTQGPTVTRFEIQPKTGVKVNRIVNLSDEIKLNLAASEIRIEAPIPGKAAIGIEIPNKEPQSVFFRDLIESDRYTEFDSNLAFAIGKDIEGRPVVYGIDDFPHLLIAGSTGSGKSVCINTLIMSILYKANPDDVKLIMIDPKVVELSVYNGIPHLLLPVVTDVKKASATLQYSVNEMQERYKKFAELGVREIKGYNRKIEEMGEDAFNRKMPHIVVIVDELAELMLQEKRNVEESIVSLTQLARAAGIHLVIATQRPSVDVITGLIKANMPSRIAFAVTSNVDSRTILDMGGAEELLGKGDMLFFPKGLKKPVRLQGGFISDKEISDVVDFINKQGLTSSDADIEEKIQAFAKKSDSQGGKAGGEESGDMNDELFRDAGFLVIDSNKASIGNIQRKFKVGFNRAARIMDQLADAGVVGPDQGTKPRDILMSHESFENYLEEYGG